MIRSTGPFRVFLLKISILGLIGAKIGGNGCCAQKRGLPKRGRDRVCSPAFRLGSKTHAEACTTCEEDGGLGLEAWRDLGGHKMVKNGQKQAKKPKIGLIFPVFMQISCFPAKKYRLIFAFCRISRFISLPEWRLRRNLAGNLTGFGSAARLRPQVKRFCRLIVPYIPGG